VDKGSIDTRGTGNYDAVNERRTFVSASEGISRIYLLAKRLAIFGSLLGAVVCFSYFLGTGRGAVASWILFVAAPPAAGGLVAVIAWVVEGFVVEPRQNHERPSSY